MTIIKTSLVHSPAWPPPQELPENPVSLKQSPVAIEERVSLLDSSRTIRSEVIEQGLKFPFPLDVNPDHSLIKHLQESPLKSVASKPKKGRNGITRILPEVVLKADSASDSKIEALVNVIFRKLGMKTPAVVELGSEAKQYVKEHIDGFEDLNPAQGLLAMSKIKGATCQDVLEQEDLRHLFRTQFENRMQELGTITIMDLLVSNNDRLVKWSSRSPIGGNHLKPSEANFGNWMYVVTENQPEAGDRLLKELCAIDNGSFERPLDRESLETDNFVKPFVELLEDDKLADIAERVLKGLNAGIDPKASRRGSLPFFISLGFPNQEESLTTLRGQAMENITEGLLKGREMLLRNGEGLEATPTSTEEEKLLLQMVINRRRALVEKLKV